MKLSSSRWSGNKYLSGTDDLASELLYQTLLNPITDETVEQ